MFTFRLTISLVIYYPLTFGREKMAPGDNMYVSLLQV